MNIYAMLEPDKSLLLKGETVVTSMRELYTSILDPDLRLLEIRPDFFDKFFTAKSLEAFIKEVKRINKMVVINCVAGVPTVKDRVLDLASVTDIDELTYLIQSKPKEMMDTIHMLVDSYTSTSNDAAASGNKLSALHLQVTELQDEITQLKNELSITREERDTNYNKLKVIVDRLSKQHGVNIDTDIFSDIDLFKYDKVLYIKEITRVHYVDTFIYYLREILKTLYNSPVRLVVIEPFNTNNRAQLYPDCKPVTDLTYDDVMHSDIFMAGYEKELMHNILYNAINVNYLIVLDRSGYSKPYLTGDKVEVLYTASDWHDSASMGLPNERTISYEGTPLVIPHVPDFRKLSLERAVQIYSSMPIMHSVIELMERR